MRFVNRLRRFVPRLPSPEPPRTSEYPDWPAWQAALAADRDRFDAQYRLQREVAPALVGDGWAGWCGLCDGLSVFRLPRAAPGEANLREALVCDGCRMNARQRASMAQVIAGQPLDRARIWLTEQTSIACVWLRGHCPGAEGSEFVVDAKMRAKLQARFERLGGDGDIVSRDVTRVDFIDGELDAIGSFDVLEHVPDYAAALGEFARVLRPGGRLVLTVPFIESAAQTLVRARLHDDGSIEHLLEPDIHRDPLSAGVLCYYHFGWDLLDTARAAGFRRAAWQRTWSPREGLFGLWTMVATR